MPEPTSAAPTQLTTAEKLDRDYDDLMVQSGTVNPPLPEPKAAAATPPEPTPENKALPERDPATGQFTKPEPVVHQHSPRLLRMAREAGIASPESLTPDQLEEEVHVSYRATMALLDEQRRRPNVAEPPQPAEPEFSIPGLKEEDWSPEFVKPLKALFAAQERRIRQLEQQVSFQAHESVSDQFDRAFARLNDTRLGAGSRHDIGESEVRRRRAVVATAKDMAGERASPQQILQKVSEAHQLLYGDAAPTPAKPTNGVAKKNGYTKEEWDDAGALRPTSRNGAAEPKGRDAATKAVAEIMQRVNTPAGGGEADELPE